MLRRWQCVLLDDVDDVPAAGLGAAGHEAWPRAGGKQNPAQVLHCARVLARCRLRRGDEHGGHRAADVLRLRECLELGARRVVRPRSGVRRVQTTARVYQLAGVRGNRQPVVLLEPPVDSPQAVVRPDPQGPPHVDVTVLPGSGVLAPRRAHREQRG